MANRPVSQQNCLGQFVDSFSADRRNLPSAEDFGRHEGYYLINDSGAERVEGQIRPTFHEKTLDLHAPKAARQLFETAAKNQCARELRQAPAPIQNHRQQSTAARKTAAISKLRLVDDDG